jgi:hypothetical protein
MDEQLKEFFYDGGAETGTHGSEDMLLKALMAGYGTDSATFTGGRALMPEDCETTMVNAMTAQREDCKIMNTFKKTPVKSTVHEFNRRTSPGDYEFGTAEEGGISQQDSQELERKTQNVKYIQQYREVTEQMNVVDTFENAFESEKLAGTINILKIAERLCIHGDAEVIPTEFDGMLKQIKSVPVDRRNLLDFRGQTIQNKGESFISEMARMIYDQGGDANKLFFPTILSEDIQDLCRDRIRFGATDSRMTAVFDSYPTPLGTLKFGEDSRAGPDKMFRVKGKIVTKGDPNRKPNAPSSVTATAAAKSNSQFITTDAGNYNYTIFAINRWGISTGVSPSAVPVASGDGVTLTITPDSSKPGTGFIICRSAKGGNVVMEMVRVGINTSGAATVYVDLNDDLPGTTDMIFITEKKLQTIAEFYQLLPLRLYRMNPVDRLVTPFILALWGDLVLKVPEWCGVTKNIAYKGGLYA